MTRIRLFHHGPKSRVVLFWLGFFWFDCLPFFFFSSPTLSQQTGAMEPWDRGWGVGGRFQLSVQIRGRPACILETILTQFLSGQISAQPYLKENGLD